MCKLMMLASWVAAVSVAAAMEITGANVITSTQTISEQVTGNGYFVVAGGTTLTLSGAGNDFTGGVIVSNGVLEATSSGAFGTGPITLEGTSVVRQVRFNVASGVFPNTITLKDKTSSTTYPAIWAVKSAKVTGKVSMDAAFAATNTSAYFRLKIDSGAPLTLEGDVDVGAACIQCFGNDATYFKGKVTAGSLFGGANSSCTGSLELYNPANDVKTLRLGSYDAVCHATNVLKGCYVQFDWADTWYYNGHCFVKLNGYDQEFRCLH